MYLSGFHIRIASENKTKMLRRCIPLTIHIVKKGDTLHKIAEHHHIKLQALIDANPHIKNPNDIQVGQKINIPSVAPSSNLHKGVQHKTNTGVKEEKKAPLITKVPIIPKIVDKIKQKTLDKQTENKDHIHPNKEINLKDIYYNPLPQIYIKKQDINKIQPHKKQMSNENMTPHMANHHQNVSNNPHFPGISNMSANHNVNPVASKSEKPVVNVSPDQMKEGHTHQLSPKKSNVVIHQCPRCGYVYGRASYMQTSQQQSFLPVYPVHSFSRDDQSVQPSNDCEQHQMPIYTNSQSPQNIPIYYDDENTYQEEQSKFSTVSSSNHINENDLSHVSGICNTETNKVKTKKKTIQNKATLTKISKSKGRATKKTSVLKVSHKRDKARVNINPWIK